MSPLFILRGDVNECGVRCLLSRANEAAITTSAYVSVCTLKHIMISWLTFAESCSVA